MITIAENILNSSSEILEDILEIFKTLNTEGLDTSNIEKVLIRDLVEDSLEYLELIVTLEDHYNINIPTNNELKTIKDLVQIIEQELACKGN